MPNVNVTCPECGKEVELKENGECPSCGLDVARVLAHDRHERALEKIRKARRADEPAPEPARKKGVFEGWF